MGSAGGGLANPPLTDPMIEKLQREAIQLKVAFDLAEKVCQTDMVPSSYRNNPMRAAVAIMWGANLGLNFMEALQNIAVIKGTPSIWGDAIPAIVMASDICEDLDVTWNPETQEATATTKRRGMEPKSYTYGIAEAKAAGLVRGDSAWDKHGKRMAENRARGWLIRNVYPDLLKGLQVSDEVEESFPDKTIIDRYITELEETDTLEQLNAVAMKIAKESRDVRQTLKAPINEQFTRIKGGS